VGHSNSRTTKAGQEAYKSITRSYYRSTIGIVLVYDITSMKSFKNILKWLDEIKNYADSSKVSIILVGNKADLTYE
jgi:small GTP-binding protein